MVRERILVGMILSFLIIFSSVMYGCGNGNPSGTNPSSVINPPSAFLTVTSPSTIVLPPASITVTSVNPSKTTISWIAVASASGYNVYRSYELAPASYTKIASNLPAASLSYTEVYAYAAGNYYFTVTAIDPVGNESPNPPDARIYIPGYPQSVSVASGSGHNTISWSPVTGATSYVLYASTSTTPITITGNTPGLINITNVTSPYIHAATNNVTYYYSVAAVSAKGESSKSKPTVFATPAANAVDPPTGIQAVAKIPAFNRIDISWNPVVTASATYNIYRSNSPNVTINTANRIATSLTAASYSNTGNGVASDTRYYYKVTAVVGVVESGGSVEVSAATIPKAPTGVSATAGVNQNTISWSPVANATSYIVYASTSPTPINVSKATAGVIKIANIASSSYIDTGLTSGITYYYAVATVTNNGESYNSATVNAIPSPGANWTTVISGTTQKLNSAAYSGSRFVAVGDLGVILASPDGVSWTVQPSSTTQNLSRVVWSGTKFVAVGDVGATLTSPDGLSWTLHPRVTNPKLANSPSPYLLGLCYNGSNQFVAIGNDGGHYTSADGISWINASQANSYQTSVAYGNGLYVAPMSDATLSTSNTGASTWLYLQTGLTTPNVSNARMYDISYGSSVFIVVGDPNTVRGGIIIRSLDGGTSWGYVTSGTPYALNGVTWTGTQFVAVGAYGTILTSSPDGSIWTTRTSGTAQSLNAVTSGQNKLVAVGVGGTILVSQ